MLRVYTNLRPVFDRDKAAVMDSILMPVCAAHRGLIETRVKSYAFEVGPSALGSKEIPRLEYIKLLNSGSFCPDLIAKEMLDITLHDQAIYFHLVDFPKGAFWKCHEKVFDLVRKAGYSKVIVDDYNRSGGDAWEKYGFTGKYLDNLRVKHLEW